MRRSARRFSSYVETNALPCTSVETRHVGQDAVVAVMNHAPSPGNEYPPVDDLIVSMVMHSNYAQVIRDIGGRRQVFRETPGAILIVPPRTPSFWSFAGTPQVMHIAIPAERVESLQQRHAGERLADLGKLAAGPLSDPFLTLLAERLWRGAADNTGLARSFCSQALNLFLSALLSRHDALDESDSRAESPLAPWRCQRVTALMLENLDKKLTIEQLAAAVELSPSHFLRAFKAAIGQSPHQWLTMKRVERAKERLTATREPLTDIALSLGFSSSAHFSTVFRSLTGLSPTQWRESFPKPPV